MGGPCADARVRLVVLCAPRRRDGWRIAGEFGWAGDMIPKVVRDGLTLSRKVWAGARGRECNVARGCRVDYGQRGSVLVRTGARVWNQASWVRVVQLETPACGSAM
jgi:hypothetical protein